MREDNADTIFAFVILFLFFFFMFQQAYIKPRSTALRIARLAAFTVVASSVILGGFILAASWIQANAARNLDLTLNQVREKRLRGKKFS